MTRSLGFLSVPLLAATLQGLEPERFLGLEATERLFLGEGPTDAARHLAGTGTLRAVMLFADFPDGERDLSMEELHDRLVPGAQRFFASSSYGRLELVVEPHYEWVPMDGPSTDPGYDCSEYAPQRRYLGEVVRKVDAEVDFRAYDAVFVVADRAPGVHNSPTFIASGDLDLRVDGKGIRHGVTFGNDIRGENWGWQTLVHEAGHILGLPDLYSYAPADVYREIHRFSGSWDPMGFQVHARQYLAWHKHKLGWLDRDRFVVAEEVGAAADLRHIGAAAGIKALVLPVSRTEAYVAEVRHLGEEDPEPGVLVYRVSVTTPSGAGPVRVMPAAPDDDSASPERARRYIALYDALHRDGGRFEDEEAGVALTVERIEDAEADDGAPTAHAARFRVTAQRVR